MTIVKVILINEETREHREDLGEKTAIEINGKQFSYIVREQMNFPQLFNYLSTCGDWIDHIEK